MEVQTKHVIGGEICDLDLEISGIKIYTDMESQTAFISNNKGTVIAKITLYPSCGEGGGGTLGASKC